MPELGDLHRNHRGQWTEHAPTHCPNGHPLGPNQVLVGHAPCSAQHRGGHRTWICRTCNTITYGPPLTDACTIVHGAG